MRNLGRSVRRLPSAAVPGHSSNVMTRLLLILLLAFSGIGWAEVTAAWKVPIGSRIPDHETAEKVRKLDKPPGESAFFEAGDELWDVSKALAWEVQVEEAGGDDPFEAREFVPMKVDWKGDWIVWNARSGMFIARGPWSQILLVGDVLGFRNQPILMRSRFEVVDGLQGGDSKLAKPRELAVVSRSGEKGRVMLEGFEAEVDGTATASGEICDLHCHLSWPSRVVGHRSDLRTGVTVREGVRTRLARQGKGPDAWEAWLTVSRELLDGTPFGKVRWIENDDGIKPWANFEPGGENIRRTLGPDRELGIYPVSESFLEALAGTGKVSILPEVVTAADIAGWSRVSLIDLGKPLRENGLKLDAAAGHFGGFDPRSNSVVVVADSTNQDLAEAIFSTGCYQPPLQLWIETNGESGGWGLACRSGEKVAISRRAGKATDLVFEIEPTLAADGHTLDLRYKFDIVVGDRAMGRVESAATLTSGKPVKVVTGSKEGAEDLEVILTGTVTSE